LAALRITDESLKVIVVAVGMRAAQEFRDGVKILVRQIWVFDSFGVFACTLGVRLKM
jgi:hypothetical protein